MCINTYMYVGTCTCWKQSIGCREQWRAHFIKINALVRWFVLLVLSILSSDWLVGLGAYGWWNHDGAGNSDVLTIICHVLVFLFRWHKIMSCMTTATNGASASQRMAPQKDLRSQHHQMSRFFNKLLVPSLICVCSSHFATPPQNFSYCCQGMHTCTYVHTCR